MKKSQDKPMADRSKVSSASPSMADKKGAPSGSSPAKGIGPEGIDMCQGEAPAIKGYSHESSPDTMEGGLQNPTGIGMGDGGPTIDMIGPDNPGKGL